MRAHIEHQPQSRYLEYTGHFKGTRSNQEQRQGSPSNADGRNSERKIKKVRKHDRHISGISNLYTDDAQNILYLTIIELPSRSNLGPGGFYGPFETSPR
jgi:hypothetical protein